MFYRHLILAGLMLSAFGIQASAQLLVDEAKAAQVKANYLWFMQRFTTWPDRALPASGVIVITVLGNDPFHIGEQLQAVIRKKTSAREIRLQQLKHGTGADFTRSVQRSHILFVTRQDMKHWKEVLKLVKGRAILTVSDDPDFLDHGGMMEFEPRERNLYINVRLSAVEEAGMKLSSNLLDLSKVTIAKKAVD